MAGRKRKRGVRKGSAGATIGGIKRIKNLPKSGAARAALQGTVLTLQPGTQAAKAARVGGRPPIEPLPRAPTPKPKILPKTVTPGQVGTFIAVSRIGQPRAQITRGLRPVPTDIRSVSSSWISTMGYDSANNVVTMITLSGHGYKIPNIAPNEWEEWYFAHSKGTFFNERIRNKKIVTRLF